MIHISLGRARWSQDVGVLAMIPVGSYPVCYLGHVLICLCLHVSMGLGLQSGICGTRWSLAQHVPLTKPCPANDVTCVDLLMMWVMMVGSTSPLLIHNQAIDGRLAANQRDMDDSVGYHTGVIEALQSLGSPCYEQNWNQMSVL